MYRLLHVRPNPYMTPYTFKEIRVAHVLTWGNSYAEIERDNAAGPSPCGRYCPTGRV